jgi:hypothetical protein
MTWIDRDYKNREVKTKLTTEARRKEIAKNRGMNKPGASMK